MGAVITVKNDANQSQQYFYSYYIFVFIFINEMNNQVRQTNTSVVGIILCLDENFIFILLSELYDAFSNNEE